MMTDTIRAALEAALKQFAASRDEAMTYCPCSLCPTQAKTAQGMAQAIAAFHRHRALDLRGAGLTPVANAHDEIAAAVEAAAKEAGE